MEETKETMLPGWATPKFIFQVVMQFIGALIFIVILSGKVERLNEITSEIRDAQKEQQKTGEVRMTKMESDIVQNKVRLSIMEAKLEQLNLFKTQ
jgi:hypothetical protein